MTLIEKLRKQADDTSNPIYWELRNLLNEAADALEDQDQVCQVSSAGYSDIVSDGGMDPRTEYERLCNEYVYESPDGGKTIYRRTPGDLLQERVK